MDFRGFLRPYFTTLILRKKEEGRYEGGKWSPGEEADISFKAAVSVFSDDSLQFGEAGTYNSDDRKIYTYEKLKRGYEVKINGDIYRITEERDYSFYANGLRMFVARRNDLV